MIDSRVLFMATYSFQIIQINPFLPSNVTRLYFLQVLYILKYYRDILWNKFIIIIFYY